MPLSVISCKDFEGCLLNEISLDHHCKSILSWTLTNSEHLLCTSMLYYFYVAFRRAGQIYCKVRDKILQTLPCDGLFS